MRRRRGDTRLGNGSLYATARDLLKFHRALQNGGLLKPETVAASHGFGRTDREVGAFWFRRERGGHRSVYVGGSSPGFKAHLERFVDDDVAVIVLSNLYIASPSVIASDIAAILWGTEEPLPPVPRRVRRPREELDRVTGTYRFASDFFTPGLLVRVERRDDYLVEIPAGTDKGIPLVPIGTNRYFDRLYWSFVRFEDGKLVYTNGGKDYVAAAQK